MKSASSPSDKALTDRHDGLLVEDGAEIVTEERKRSPIWVGLLVGAATGLIASGSMLWVGREWGGAIVAQLIADRTTDILPLSAVRRGIQDLEENAKPATLAGITLAQVAGCAIIGAFYSRFAGHSIRARLVGGITLIITVWLALSLIISPLGDIGIFARDTVRGLWQTQILFILASVIFGGLTALFVPWPDFSNLRFRKGEARLRSADQTSVEGEVDELRPYGEEPLTSNRRIILKVAGIGALAIPAFISAGYIGRYMNQLRTAFSPELATRTENGPGAFAVAGMPEEITPTEAFYIVSKNLVDPTVDAADWTLEIDGMVDRPLSFSYTDILARPSVDFGSTLECISNSVGGGFISTTIWTGFPLRDLLEEAGLQDGIVDLELHAADDYVESIPLAKGLAPNTMLVHSMDGEPLSDKHGFPLRLIVPGIFGMKNVKWITRIRPVNEDILGFWQERDWSDAAPVLTMSRIDIPEDGYKAQLGEIVKIGGVAFSGDREISRVEITVDGGESWHEAQLSDPVSDLTWRLWIVDFEALEPGLKRLAVRATDGNGQLQTETEAEPLPDGATGWHRKWFEVLDANGNSVPFHDDSPIQDDGNDWVRNGSASDRPVSDRS